MTVRLSWVLDHSPSVFVPVIRERMRMHKRADQECGCFARGADWFAVVRWQDPERHWLVLAIPKPPLAQSRAIG